jgi:hypothetical protein
MKAFEFAIIAVSKVPHYKSHWLEFIAKEGGFKLIARIIVTEVDQNFASVLGVRVALDFHENLHNATIRAINNR